MRRAPSLLLPLLLCACGGRPEPAPTPPTAPAEPVATVPEGPGTVADGTFHSDALGVDKHYVVYLPAGYEAAPDRRYPVIYMLNGLGGGETNWVAFGKLDQAANGLHLQAIVVMPDGDSSFYANSVTPAPALETCRQGQPTFAPAEEPETYCVATPRYEDYITQDLIAHVDHTYRTIASRDARGIGGLSMGGFGALELAMRHPDLYAAVASHSGVDALLYAGPHPYQPGQAQLADDVSQWGAQVEPIGAHVRAIFGPELANWQAHDPAYLAAQLHDGDLAIYLDCGTEDEFLLNDAAQYLHEVLTSHGIQHEWYLGPGHHDFAFWIDRIDDSLAFFASHLQER